jgi:hypothetical protein
MADPGRSKLAHTLMSLFAWTIGTVLVPLGLVWFLIAVKNATFDGAVQQESLVTIAISIASASIAIEFILDASEHLTKAFRYILILIFGGALMFFAGTSTVSHKTHVVTSSLNAGQIKASVYLLVIAALLGVITVTRQAARMKASE